MTDFCFGEVLFLHGDSIVHFALRPKNPCRIEIGGVVLENGGTSLPQGFLPQGGRSKRIALDQLDGYKEQLWNCHARSFESVTFLHRICRRLPLAMVRPRKALLYLYVTASLAFESLICTTLIPVVCLSPSSGDVGCVAVPFNRGLSLHMCFGRKEV